MPPNETGGKGGKVMLAGMLCLECLNLFTVVIINSLQVPKAGLEPALPYGNRTLNATGLPISPLRQGRRWLPIAGSYPQGTGATTKHPGTGATLHVNRQFGVYPALRQEFLLPPPGRLHEESWTFMVRRNSHRNGYACIAKTSQVVKQLFASLPRYIQ